MSACVTSRSARTPPSSCAACSPQAMALCCAAEDCSTAAATAVRAATTRRAAASTAARAARVSGVAGMRSMRSPRSAAMRSPSSEVPRASSSHSCQSFRAAASCWSARREFCCRASISSRARASLSSCQYSLRTSSSPTACSSHWNFSWWRWSRKNARRASSVIGSWAPSGSFWPAARAFSTWEATARSSSPSLPQVVCCTASQAPLTLSCLELFMAPTSCLMRATKVVQPSGCPPTVFGFGWHVATS
mmetsp:Transcript_80153/g.144719  ORF Transcript_80153/g.144719 Transcript_80153/m.144719 type:complete len:248 (-) Transcript_80153:1357-2100(-)